MAPTARRGPTAGRYRALAVLTSLTLSAGCVSAHAPAAPAGSQTGTPLETVNSWFRAINSGDVRGARQLFAEDPDQTGWIPDAPRPAFTGIRCREVTPPAGGPANGGRAAVHCTFREAPGDWMGNPDNSWTVGLVEGTGGRWLITGYGQG